MSKTYADFPYENYVPETAYIRIPSITADPTRDTREAIEAAADAYLRIEEGELAGAAADYKQAVLSQIEDLEYVRAMFQRDLLAAIGLATIDYSANTYTPNEKANEIFDEAALGQRTTSRSGLAAIGVNAKRIYDNIYTLDDGPGPVYSATSPAEEYDPRALATVLPVSGTNTPVTFYLDSPATSGTVRAYTSYVLNTDAWDSQYTLSYDRPGDRWIVKSGDLLICWASSIDDGSIEWQTADDSSTSSGSSSSGE